MGEDGQSFVEERQNEAKFDGKNPKSSKQSQLL